MNVLYPTEHTLDVYQVRYNEEATHWLCMAFSWRIDALVVGEKKGHYPEKQ